MRRASANTRTPESAEELSTSHDAQDIVCLNLERAVLR